MSTPVEVVVLAMAGVVCDFVPERRLRVLTELTGQSHDAVERALSASGLDDSADHGAIAPDAVYEVVARALDRPMRREDVRRAWASAFLPDHDLLGLVRRVRRPTALLTNNGPIIEDCLAEELAAVTTAFDRLLASWRLGATTPDPEVFAKVTAALGVRPSTILYVDASLVDVRAGARAGWLAHRHRGVAKLHELFSAHELLAAAPAGDAVRPAARPGPSRRRGGAP